ncbi:uncharacterized protein B0I36DRAFT_330202 [Microdochium trichocladiopsis]|uniref:Uncharacterized protein n=1 Tax=Microdochium trichocladiopsis TaxID=1682393 RepID=A0A9P9BMU4_9PEZI|nr:uncharacterized protein B0I36DRAFT_330202 [Microdochium trichocladiopsis]KAH7026246.1 hypothetical protein B0I36DRAFT_330202 [Microdochium trichocladiopsis]
MARPRKQLCTASQSLPIQTGLPAIRRSTKIALMFGQRRRLSHLRFSGRLRCHAKLCSLDPGPSTVVVTSRHGYIGWNDIPTITTLNERSRERGRGVSGVSVVSVVDRHENNSDKACDCLASRSSFFRFVISRWSVHLILHRDTQPLYDDATNSCGKCTRDAVATHAADRSRAPQT